MMRDVGVMFSRIIFVSERLKWSDKGSSGMSVRGRGVQL